MIDFDKIAEDFEKNKEESIILSLNDQFKNEYNDLFVLEVKSGLRKFNYDLNEYFRKMNKFLEKISPSDILLIDYREETLHSWKHRMDITLRNSDEFINDFRGFCDRCLSDGCICSGVIENAIYGYKEAFSDFENDMEKFCFSEYMIGITIKESIRNFSRNYITDRFIYKSLDEIGALVVATGKNKLEIWEHWGHV